MSERGAKKKSNWSVFISVESQTTGKHFDGICFTFLFLLFSLMFVKATLWSSGD